MNNIDWDDIDSCVDCEHQYDIAELHDVDGELVCQSCVDRRGEQ